MTYEEIVQKNLTLSTEFSRYLLEHPEFAESLPDKAHVVLLPKDDPQLYRSNLETARRYHEQEKDADRPVVYIEVEALAPQRSRLLSPRLVSKPLPSGTI